MEGANQQPQVLMTGGQSQPQLVYFVTAPLAPTTSPFGRQGEPQLLMPPMLQGSAFQPSNMTNAVLPNGQAPPSYHNNVSSPSILSATSSPSFGSTPATSPQFLQLLPFQHLQQGGGTAGFQSVNVLSPPQQQATMSFPNFSSAQVTQQEGGNTIFQTMPQGIPQQLVTPQPQEQYFNPPQHQEIRPTHLSVTFAPPRDIERYNNLFVASFPRTMVDSDLFNIFQPYNPLRATIMMDVARGCSKGFGFVLFASAEDGYRACNELNCRRVTVCGTTITLHVSASSHDGGIAAEESPSVYFRNIPLDTAVETIEAVFRQFGAIKAVAACFRDPVKQHLLVCIEFESTDIARNAISNAHGKILFQNQTIPIMARFAENSQIKSQRRKKNFTK